MMKLVRWVLPLSFLCIAGAANAQAPTEYTLTVKPTALKVGQPGTVEVVITSNGPWHWNSEFPAKLEFAAANTTIARPLLRQADGDFKGDATTVTATFAVTATQAGARQGMLTGKLGFCDDKVCVTKKVELPVSVVATP